MLCEPGIWYFKVKDLVECDVHHIDGEGIVKVVVHNKDGLSKVCADRAETLKRGLVLLASV